MGNQRAAIFEAIVSLSGRDGFTDWEAIVDATSLSEVEVQETLRDLHERGLILGQDVTGIDNPGGFELVGIRLA